MKKTINNFLIFIGLFVLDIVYSAIIIAIAKQLGFDINSLNNITKSIYLIIIDISFMLILYILYLKELNHEFFKYIRHFFKNFFFGFKLWILGLILMVGTNVIINLIYPSIAINEEAVQNSLKMAPLYTAFASCIFAPFVEELIFRKSLKKVFSNNTLFIIISGFLFGLAHNLSTLLTGTNANQLLYIIPYGLFGCIFAYMYVKKKNIFIPITFHMIHNTILTIASLTTIGVI